MSIEVPVIIEMQVIPVAGYDSMLMTLSGAHSAIFTRNIVILTDSTGNKGVGEIHGGDSITEALNACKPLVIGQSLSCYKKLINTIKKAGSSSENVNSEGIQSLDLKKLANVVQSETAIESAMLDLLGKFLGVPVCELLGDGKQRDEIEILGYLFYISDARKTDLGYLFEDDSSDEWFKVRRETTLTKEALVKQAIVARNKYGFKNFKLKGGVLDGKYEIETIRALKEALPEAGINIDPNGAWTLKESISLCKDLNDVMSYVEDPCGPESGFSSREIMSEFKNATQFKTATNMIATNWRQFYHAASLKSVDIILADPHFWGMNGSVRMAQILNDWGLVWGSHSNNHFDISLAMFAHVAASAPGKITPMDTHWIWQDGQDLCNHSMKIVDGMLKVEDKPGLGIEIDMDKIEKAHELYKTLNSTDRDDALSMQALIKDWKFDPKKPCLVR